MKWYQMQWAQKYWGTAARKRYQRYLQSDAWKIKRNAVLHAAGFRCRRCSARATEVHHETYKRIYNERLSDLTALCGRCHKAGHSRTPKRYKKGTPRKKGYQKPKQRKFYRKRKVNTKGSDKRSRKRMPARQ